ncbi:hypothetical protein F9470_11065 [Escherichia coli]|nr:hypothetical protein [Escherichia coli]EFH3741189.1 hypothetical protein [Escherichia coli]EFH8606148.1 hypothetical protein [Escherichia coli]EFK2863755.1 hypothetical protein [Escherichia coli]EFT2935001.1 hypothetical protein [Escherichia coli]
MKNIAAQMVNFDREQMRRIANNMPEQYDEKPQVQQVGEFAELLELIQAFGTERGVKWSDEARLALEWKARWGDRAA